MRAPTHGEVVALWSSVIADLNGDEAALLVLPSEDKIVASAFRPSEEMPLIDCILESVAQMVDAKELAAVPLWGALAVPSFTHLPPDGNPEPFKHGDLQQRYVEGDMSVVETLLVIVQTLDEEATPPRGQSFRQPLLEPMEDEPADMAMGPMTAALVGALMFAHMIAGVEP